MFIAQGDPNLLEILCERNGIWSFLSGFATGCAASLRLAVVPNLTFCGSRTRSMLGQRPEE